MSNNINPVVSNLINCKLPTQFLKDKDIVLEDPEEHIRIINDLYKFYPESDEDSAQYRSCIPSLIVRTLMQCYDPNLNDDIHPTECFQLFISCLDVSGVDNCPDFCSPWIKHMNVAFDKKYSDPQTIIFYNFETDNFTLFVRSVKSSATLSIEEYDETDSLCTDFNIICTHREICEYLNFFLDNFKVKTSKGDVIGSD